MDAKILLGKRIRYLRRVKELSQENLAEKANISAKYLGEIERGQANLTIDVTEQLAAALKIEMTELFDYQHEADSKHIKSRINTLIKEADSDDLKLIYRILKSVMK